MVSSADDDDRTVADGVCARVWLEGDAVDDGAGMQVVRSVAARVVRASVLTVADAIAITVAVHAIGHTVAIAISTIFAIPTILWTIPVGRLVRDAAR